MILALIAVNLIVTKPNGARGVDPGQRMPPFAVPLVLGRLSGDADIATRPGQGSRGNVPACRERGPQILNVCQLYERGPVVLALFIDAGGGADVVGDLQALTRSFPGVQFAAVALRADREHLRRVVRRRGLTLPVGWDRDGVLLALYKAAVLPQITFAYPGGVVQSRALHERPPIATLRARVRALVAASRARGWRAPAR